MSKKLEELRSKIAALASEMLALADKDTDFDEAEQVRWTEGNAELDELRAQEAEEARLEQRREAVRSIAAANPAAAVSGDGATGGPTFYRQNTDDIYDLTTVRANVNDRHGVADELRDRALRSIDTKRFPDEERGNLERLLKPFPGRDPKKVAEHILLTGSPDYMREFNQYAQTGQIGPRIQEARASLTLSGGAALIPYSFDPTLILTNNGAENPFRQIADVVSITTDDHTYVTTAGVTAEWLAESSQVADATPTLSSVEIDVHKAAAHVQLTWEFNMDSTFNSELTRLFADAKDRLEATAFATGSGSGQPFGVVTELQLVTASRVAGSSGAAGAADFVLADVYAVDNALPPRYRPNASWVAEHTIYNRIRRFGEGSAANNSTFWVDLGGGQPPVLIGYPTYKSSAMDSTIVSGSNDDILILGDFRQGYKIVDRIGMATLFNPLVIGANQRPIGEVGWTVFWRVGARVVDANAFRMLRV